MEKSFWTSEEEKNYANNSFPEFTLTSEITISERKKQKLSEAFAFKHGVFPITFPRIECFHLHVSLIGDNRFPFPTLGLIHVSNTVEMFASDMNGAYSVTCKASDFIEKSTGWFFTIESIFRQYDVIIWKEKSVYLSKHRPKKNGIKSSQTELYTMIGDSIELGTVTMQDSRSYAKISHDYNPIHLSSFSARLFGLPGAIIHGMWSQSRIAAEYSTTNRVQFIKCDFRKPLFLPTDIQLITNASEKEAQFELRSDSSSRICVTGTVRFLESS